MEQFDNVIISEAINILVKRTSEVLLEEFLLLPKELHLNIILIKSAQMLLANILCHIAHNKEEIFALIAEQYDDINDLTLNCINTAFAKKFGAVKH